MDWERGRDGLGMRQGWTGNEASVSNQISYDCSTRVSV